MGGIDRLIVVMTATNVGRFLYIYIDIGEKIVDIDLDAFNLDIKKLIDYFEGRYGIRLRCKNCLYGYICPETKLCKIAQTQTIIQGILNNEVRKHTFPQV